MNNNKNKNKNKKLKTTEGTPRGYLNEQQKVTV